MPANRLPQIRGVGSTGIQRREDQNRRSVSNSELASFVFDGHKIGLAAYAKYVAESLTAEKSIYNKHGREVAKVPDRQARQWAAEQIRDVFGCRFIPEQKQEAVPIHFIQIVQEILSGDYRELKSQEEWARAVEARIDRDKTTDS